MVGGREASRYNSKMLTLVIITSISAYLVLEIKYLGINQPSFKKKIKPNKLTRHLH
jgi:hypothetical protein